MSDAIGGVSPVVSPPTAMRAPQASPQVPDPMRPVDSFKPSAAAEPPLTLTAAQRQMLTAGAAGLKKMAGPDGIWNRSDPKLNDGQMGFLARRAFQAMGGTEKMQEGQDRMGIRPDATAQNPAKEAQGRSALGLSDVQHFGEAMNMLDAAAKAQHVPSMTFPRGIAPADLEAIRDGQQPPNGVRARGGGS